MPITKWESPIYEKQIGEVDREYHYLKQYYSFYGNLREFSEILEYSFKKQHSTNLPKTFQLYEEFLEDHPIEFLPYDIKKGKPPSYDMLLKWNGGVNAKCEPHYTWDNRRANFQNENTKLLTQNLAAQLAEKSPYIFNTLYKGFEETEEAIENDRCEGKFNSHKVESATRARNNVIDGLLKVTGKDKDVNINAEVSSEVNMDSTVDIKHHSVSEDLILSPVYVELTRKLLEDVTNEKGIDS